MTSFKKYLTYRIRATAILTLVLCLFAVILTATTLRVRPYEYDDVYINEYNETVNIHREGARVSGLEIVFLILGATCTVLPVIEFGGLKNKRNADTIYSIPIDRRKLGVAHFTNGYIQILAVYLCAAVTASLILITDGFKYLDLRYLFPLFALPIPASLLLYAYFTYLFNEANSTVDGCLFIVSGILMPFIFCMCMSGFTVYGPDGKYIHTIFSKMDESEPFPYFLITKSTNFFSSMLNNKSHHEFPNISFPESLDGVDITMLTVWTVLCLLSAVGLYLAFSRKRAEKIGDISNSWVGYKTIIPFAMFCITFAIGDSGDYFIAVIGAVAAVIGYMLYRRSFKIRLRDVLSIAGAVALAILLTVIEEIGRVVMTNGII